MLVLTTMFINVSNNLPKTSYVKMIDIWLIFNLLLPFIEVLVHTYMDSLRFESSPSFVENLPRNDEDREINHHGRPVEVGGDNSRPASGITKVHNIICYISFLVLKSSEGSASHGHGQVPKDRCFLVCFGVSLQIALTR